MTLRKVMMRDNVCEFGLLDSLTLAKVVSPCVLLPTSVRVVVVDNIPSKCNDKNQSRSHPKRTCHLAKTRHYRGDLAVIARAKRTVQVTLSADRFQERVLVWPH